MKYQKPVWKVAIAGDLTQIVRERQCLAKGIECLDYVAANCNPVLVNAFLDWADKTVALHFPGSDVEVGKDFFVGVFDDALDSDFILPEMMPGVKSVLHFIISAHPIPFTDEQEEQGGIYHAVLLRDETGEIISFGAELDEDEPSGQSKTLQ